MKVWPVVEKRATGFGPSVFVGELRTADDEPIAEHLNGKPDGEIVYPMSVGVTEAEVRTLLQKRAETLRLEYVDNTTGQE